MVLLLGVSMITAEEFTTGGIYVQAASESQTCNLLSKTTNLVQKLIVGKTYRLESDVMEIKSKAGESVAMVFSTGLQTRVSQNSTFSVDAFNQLVVNNEGQPEALNAEYAVTSLTLMDGELEVISPQVDTNSQCIIQTPLVNVNLAEGRLVIKSNPKYVMLNAIEGAVTVVDSRNRKSVIDKGQMGLIIPYPGRDGEIMVTTKAISPEELEKHTKNLNELALAKKNVLFVVIDSKIVGIRLK